MIEWLSDFLMRSKVSIKEENSKACFPKLTATQLPLRKLFQQNK
jgi:hypothetical protein